MGPLVPRAPPEQGGWSWGGLEWFWGGFLCFGDWVALALAAPVPASIAGGRGAGAEPLPGNLTSTFGGWGAQ